MQGIHSFVCVLLQFIETCSWVKHYWPYIEPGGGISRFSVITDEPTAANYNTLLEIKPVEIGMNGLQHH